MLSALFFGGIFTICSAVLFKSVKGETTFWGNARKVAAIIFLILAVIYLLPVALTFTYYSFFVVLIAIVFLVILRLVKLL